MTRGMVKKWIEERAFGFIRRNGRGGSRNGRGRDAEAAIIRHGGQALTEVGVMASDIRKIR